MFIAGIFLTSIFIACIKAQWIEINSPLYADNNGNVNFSKLNESNVKTTEAVNVEGFLEILGDVYSNNHTIESTTEMSSSNSENESLFMQKLKQSFSDLNEMIGDNDELLDNQDTTASPSPNPCTITSAVVSKCEITCSNAESRGLSAALIAIINTELKERPDCSGDVINLKLKNINFFNSGLTESWIENLNIDISELTIDNSPTLRGIHGNAFKSEEFEQMTTLVIDGAGSSFISLESENSFSGASNLKVLVISNYQLIIFVEDYALTSLKDTLTDLEITKISKIWNVEGVLKYSQLQKLEQLNLQQNNFLDTTFTGRTFDVIKDTVKRINLSNSNVTKLSADTFAGCTKIEYLDLKNNLIESLPSGIFDDLENLKYLYVQNNTLKSLPNGLFDTQLRSGTLLSANFLNNPWHCDFNILYLKNFLTATRASISIGKCVTPEALSDRVIKELWCKIDACMISCENTGDMELSSVLDAYQMSSCEEITLNLKSHNFEKKTIFSHWLSHLQYKINKLAITLSNVESIIDEAFNSSTFEFLNELIIDHNIESTFIIEAEGFVGLNSIKILKIERTSALSLFSTFSILEPIKSSLTEVSLSHITNSFNPSQIFSQINMENLKILRLSGNEFKSVQFTNKTFEGIHESVEEIYMENSKVTNFRANAFSGFQNLRVIDLSGNDLASLDGRFFAKSLVSINLSNANLKTIENDTFAGAIHLENLDLSDNLLDFIHAEAFDDLENLENLNLQNNLLTSIPNGLFNTQIDSGKLLALNLLNNSWHCDANILYLKKVLLFSHANVLINECASPEIVSGRDIKDLWCKLESCTIICRETDETELPSILGIYQLPFCDQIEVHLNSHTFKDNTISKNWMSTLPFNIHKLSIISSNMESIKNEAFNSRTFENLHTLHIVCNDQTTFRIETNGFLGLNSIENLSIEKSAAISLSSSYSILGPITNTLRDVSISNITNSFNPNQIFERPVMENMKVLRLNGNSFRSFQFNSTTFSGIHDSLEEIFLQNSGIFRVTADAFSKFEHLKYVHLEGNNLTTLAPTFFGDYSSDENFKIFISKNPWNCTCDIKFMLDFIADENDVLCSTPEEYAGENIFKLGDVCREEITPTIGGTIPTSRFSTSTSQPSTSTTTLSSTTTSIRTSTSQTPGPGRNTTEENTTEENTTPEVTNTTPEIETSSTKSDTTTTEYSTTQRPTLCDETTGLTGRTISTSYPGSLTLTCTDPNQQQSTTQYQLNQRLSYASSTRSPLELDGPFFEITFRQTVNSDEVNVELSDVYVSTVLLYYPTHINPLSNDPSEDARLTARCIYVSERVTLVTDLAPDVLYNFCALNPTYLSVIDSPFQCRPFHTSSASSESELQGNPWIYEEQKAIILTSISLIVLMSLILGIILTYLMIRKYPTLIRGSKRVVLVNNRAKEVMILPRNSTQSISSSCRKESLTPIRNEPPTYLTPLPRQSIDNRPPFVRSSSDTSLKSYVSVSRLPPRFSQVYQRGDFDNDVLRNNGGYPCCAPTAAPCHMSPEVPPPLPRRSIISTASSTQHSCASTAEIGRTMSRKANHNSTYRRHPRPVEVEQENLYNVII